MLLYLLRRLLFAVVALLLVSVATFSLSHCSGGDPIPYDYDDQPAAYLARARQIGLDKPLFYFALRSAALPDTLHRILPLSVREHLTALAQKSGNWPALERYWEAVSVAEGALRMHADKGASFALTALRFARTPEEAGRWLDTLRVYGSALPEETDRAQVRQQLVRLEQAQKHWAEHTQRWKTLVPRLCWYGADNRYHRWLVGFLSGNPGVSVVTGNPLLVELRPRLYATLLINGAALALAYAIGVPLGMFMARRHRQWADSSLRLGLLFLYSMPVIWLGSALLLLFARPDLGLGLLNGATVEPWLLSGKPFWRWVVSNADRMLLPVLTLSLHHCTVIALQMRTGLVEALQKDYIRTARAKGLSERAVFWRHAFRDGLFPVITTFGYLFPVLFSGSLVVEYLFDFPGMGVKMQNSFAQHDYPVLFAMVMFIAGITLLGMLIADALYAWADPRVRLGQNSS